MWTTCYVHMSNKKNCGGELQGGSYDPPPLVVRVTKKVGSRKVKGFLTGHESETGAYRLNGWS